MDVIEIYPVKKFNLQDRFIRRGLDLSAGLVMLLLSSPIWLLAAVAVRIETKGNPFFIQTRIGLGGRPFKIVKLRGMYIDA
jgi:lipopolysaccharide/colanic/teichoic acid biosynthesis glycosyltransferase